MDRDLGENLVDWQHFDLVNVTFKVELFCRKFRSELSFYRINLINGLMMRVSTLWMSESPQRRLIKAKIPLVTLIEAKLCIWEERSNRAFWFYFWITIMAKSNPGKRKKMRMKVKKKKRKEKILSFFFFVNVFVCVSIAGLKG